MLCKSCGANVGSEYRLCPYCRSELEYPKQNNSGGQPTIIVQNVVTNTNNVNPPYSRSVYSPKSKSTALILCILGIFGFAGLHRFYVGKPLSGILYFFTFGGFLIGTIIDLLSISRNNFKDKNGLPLEK